MEALTKYLAAAPETVVIAGVVPVRLPASVAVTVVAVAAAVCVVNSTVANPLASVVLVALAKAPFRSDLLQVKTTPALVTGLLFTSASWAVMVTALPAAGE